MQPSDIGALVSAGSPRVSPDGRRVAFVVTRVDADANCYHGQIWLVPAVGSGPAEPFTSGEHRDGNPTWSPDGRRLAYTSTGPDGDTALRIAPVAAGGETVTVGRFDEAVTGLVWSPDARHLAFACRVRDARYEITDPRRQPPRRITRFFSRLDDVGWVHDRPKHVHVVAADGSGPAVDITPGERQFWAPAWAPDGATLAFAGAAHETWDLDFVTDVFTWRADAGIVRVTPGDGAYDHPSWSPDGSRLALLGHPEPTRDPQNSRLGVVAAGGGPVAWISGGLDRNLAPFGGTRAPVWDGDEVLATADDRGDISLYRFAAAGDAGPALAVGGERWVTDFDLAGGTLAFAATTMDRPAEIFTATATATGEERRSTVTEAFVARVRPAPAERFTAPSTADAEVDVWVVLPPGFDSTGRYPALLNIHGGPFTQYGNRFFDEAQVQAAAGYVVIMANPRGSAGREEAWARAIVGPKAPHDPGHGWGSVDYDDVMATTDEALRRYPAIDPARLGVLGGSYGGFMTTWVVAHTNRFAAACSERAVNDLILEEYAADIATGFRFTFGATWFEDPEEYRRMSPITYVRDIETPLLILHSEDDLRCPIAGAEQLFVALRLLGREVEFYRFPAEGHELSRSGSPVHRIQRAELILDWFDRKLRP